MHEVNDISELFDLIKKHMFDEDSYPVKDKPYYYVKDETWKEKKKKSNLKAWGKFARREK